MWYIHTVKYYLETGMKYGGMHITQIDFGNSMVSKRSQSQKTTYVINPFILNSKVDLWFQGLGGEEEIVRSDCLMGTGLLLGASENAQKLY